MSWLLSTAVPFFIAGKKRHFCNASSSSFQTPVSVESLGLTQRQTEVLALLLKGHPNKLIARDLGLTEGTVKIHISAILRSLGVVSRTGAVVRAQALGLDATRR